MKPESKTEGNHLSVIITTHNRKEDLRNTLDQLARLDPPPAEILVCADGCSDGTEDMIRSHYPWLRLLVHHPGRGSVSSRDRMLRECRQRYVLCLDDDSYPVENDFVIRALELFSRFPGAGIVTFPQRSEEYPNSLKQTDFGPDFRVGDYPNSGAVYDRELYLETSGFPEFFFHAYEEPDYALQVIAAGKQVHYHTGLTIRHHFTSTGRNEGRTHRRHARNEAASILLRAPWWIIPLLLPYRAFRQFQYAWKRGMNWVVREPLWWWNTLLIIPRCIAERQPIPWDAYRRWLHLLGHPQPVHTNSMKEKTSP